MTYLLGLDLGTSSAKAMIVDESGNCISRASREYGVECPAAGYAEQNGETLWDAMADCIQEVLSCGKIRADQVAAVGLSGQMHGLALVDKGHRLIRPIIIWLDRRSAAQVSALNTQQSSEKDKNNYSTGFFLPSLLWVRDQEPHNYARIRFAMLPKDYIRLRLCGEIGTDASDASGTLLFDPAADDWNRELATRLGIRTDILPQCRKAWELAGAVTPEVAARTGLAAGTPVVYGGSDSSMQLVGSGCVKTGNLNANIGTGSQFAVICDYPVLGKGLNAFRHSVPGKWSTLAASLNGGCVLKWLRDDLFPGMGGYAEMDGRAGEVPAGCGGLVCLPYMNGERFPNLDPQAKGLFFGFRPEHRREHFIRAAMESIVFAFRRGSELFLREGLPLDDRVVASGGGANSALWLQIQADILGREVITNRNKEEACLGAAIMAGIGIGLYADAAQGTEAAIQRDSRIFVPDPTASENLEQSYQIYCALYERNKELFSM